jgi:hypothetical protein
MDAIAKTFHITKQEMHDHVIGICTERGILVNWCKRLSIARRA